MLETGKDSSIHLRDYLDVVKRRRLPILIVFVLVVGLVLASTFMAEKEYTATTKLLIEQSSQHSFSLQEALAVDSSATDFYQTQFRLIESRALATDVVKRLKLYQLHEFGKPLPEDLKDGQSPPGKEEAIRIAVKIFAGKLKVKPIKNTRLVDISFTSLDPLLAAKIANTIAQSYLDYVMDRRLQVSQMAVTFLARRLEEQKRKLQVSQLALQEYMEKHQLATVISDNYNSVITEKLAELNQRLVEAETKRKEAEIRYQLALQAKNDPKKLEGIMEFLESPLIQKVRERELEISKREADLNQRYGPRHPKIIALNAEKKALQTEYAGEINRIVRSLHNQLKVAQANEKALRDALNQQKNQAMDIRKKAIGFNVIKREVNTNQQLFDMLLSKIKEARIAEEIDVGTVTVIDKALVPSGPSRPQVKLNIIIGVVAGLFIALLFGFILEYMDNTIKLPNQLEEKLGLPLLGTIPFDRNIFTKRGQNQTDAVKPILNTITDPKSVTIEPLRMVRASISLSKAGKPPRTLVVSSAVSSEGKTIISAFLATAFAEAGGKILLIDGDLRKPRQHKIWGLDNQVGMSTFLSGQANIDSCIHANVIQNMDIITSGPIPPSPSELFQSRVMSDLFVATNRVYSQIIIDSPPILPLADPIILGSLADGMVMVVAAGKLPIYALQQAVDRLKKANINILGTVLNQTEKARSDYYYGGYKHKYYYRYDYYESDQERAKKTS